MEQAGIYDICMASGVLRSAAFGEVGGLEVEGLNTLRLDI